MQAAIKDRRRHLAVLILSLAAVAVLILRELSADAPSGAELLIFGLLLLLIGFALLTSYLSEGRLADRVASEESRYRFVAEQAPVISYLCDPGERGAWRYVSPHITQLLGFTPEEWLADPMLWERQVHPDDVPLAMADERRALDTGIPNATDYRIRTREGEEIWVRDVALGLERDGKQMSQGVIYDITGLKRAEEGLRTKERMLRGIVRERTRELERSRVETLQRLAIAAELHEEGNRDHTARVGRTAAALARELGLSPGFIELIAQAATLHDIGKLGVSNEILLRPRSLSPSEQETMRQHTIVGARILEGSDSPTLRLAEQIALTHHECWDGTGYPRGLAGEDIPIAGRITMVSDVFDALTHERTYKDPWPVERAQEVIREGSGNRFDPKVVEAFFKVDPDSLMRPVRTSRRDAAILPLGRG